MTSSDEEFITLDSENRLFESSKCECISLVDDMQGFSVTILNEKQELIKIIWNKNVISYRKTDESDRIELINTLLSQGVLDGVVFLVYNSIYKNWIIEQGYSINSNILYHFMIKTSNDIIDVIDYDYPDVLLIPSEAAVN